MCVQVLVRLLVYVTLCLRTRHIVHKTTDLAQRLDARIQLAATRIDLLA